MPRPHSSCTSLASAASGASPASIPPPGRWNPVGVLITPTRPLASAITAYAPDRTAYALPGCRVPNSRSRVSSLKSREVTHANGPRGLQAPSRSVTSAPARWHAARSSSAESWPISACSSSSASVVNGAVPDSRRGRRARSGLRHRRTAPAGCRAGRTSRTLWCWIGGPILPSGRRPGCRCGTGCARPRRPPLRSLRSMSAAACRRCWTPRP